MTSLPPTPSELRQLEAEAEAEAERGWFVVPPSSTSLRFLVLSLDLGEAQALADGLRSTLAVLQEAGEAAAALEQAEIAVCPLYSDSLRHFDTRELLGLAHDPTPLAEGQDLAEPPPAPPSLQDVIVLVHYAEGRVLLTDQDGFYNSLLTTASDATGGNVFVALSGCAGGDVAGEANCDAHTSRATPSNASASRQAGVGLPNDQLRGSWLLGLASHDVVMELVDGGQDSLWALHTARRFLTWDERPLPRQLRQILTEAHQRASPFEVPEGLRLRCTEERANRGLGGLLDDLRPLGSKIEHGVAKLGGHVSNFIAKAHAKALAVHQEHQNRRRSSRAGRASEGTAPEELTGTEQNPSAGEDGWADPSPDHPPPRPKSIDAEFFAPSQLFGGY